MKTPLRVLALLSLSVILLCPPLVSATPILAKSTITAVTVYGDRAVVTRTAALDLTASGVTEVIFDQLPASLLEESLQVSGRGAAQATILDVTAKPDFVDYTPNNRVKAVEDELRGLTKQRRALDDRAALLKAQDATLTKIEAGATATPAQGATPRLTMEESGKLLLFLAENRAKLATENQTLATELEELAAKIEAAQRRLNELRGSARHRYFTVTVRLDVAAAGAGALDLALSYAVADASWSPSYDARVNANEKSIALAYHGTVRQTTGEDWKAVALTLSTARPSLGGAAPEQEPWTLDAPLNVARAKSSGSLGLVRADPAAAQSATAAMAPMANAIQVGSAAQSASAALDQAATSASFKVAAPATVPSDNSPQKVPIISAALTAAFEYNTTPKLSAAAFLVAKVVNGSDYPFLAGPLNVFLDGTFVAADELRTVMPGEKFDLALGVDDGISVKHRRLKRFTEDTGLTSSGKRITYEYLITLQNNKKTLVHLTVSDRLPVSRNERIVVKQLVPDAKELKPGAEGALKWTLDLKPGEKRDLTLKFTIDHPNDLQTTGLEP